MYKMPNVVKYLVENAEKTGKWDPSSVVAEVFKKMGEPNWEKMPMLVKKLEDNAENGKVNAIQIYELNPSLFAGEHQSLLQ